MSELNIEIPTHRQSLVELRTVLDRELAQRLPPGMLESRWEGDALHLSGAGADAVFRIEKGHLIGRARLGPPASMMRTMIEQKMTEILSVVAAYRDDD